MSKQNNFPRPQHANNADRLTQTDPERQSMGSTPDREDRHMEDRERVGASGTMLDENEIAHMLRNEFIQEALPSVPKVPGWHFCWLSTTNSYDPIPKRMKLGYIPVKVGEIAGFNQHDVKEGEWAGFISCNEMVMFKIEDSRYQKIMAFFHHQLPLEEEQAIAQRLASPDGADKQTDVVLEDGFKNLQQESMVTRRGKFNPD